MAVVEALLEILRMPTSWAMMQFLGPVWIAFFLGVMVGWAWKPKWATLGNCKFDFYAPSSPSTFFQGFGSAQSSDSCDDGTASCSLDDGLRKEQKAKPLIDSDTCRLILCLIFEKDYRFVCLIDFYCCLSCMSFLEPVMF